MVVSARIISQGLRYLQKPCRKYGCDRYLSALPHLEFPNRPDGDQKQSEVRDDVKYPCGTENPFTTEAETSRLHRIPDFLAWYALSNRKSGYNDIKTNDQSHGDHDGTVQD